MRKIVIPLRNANDIGAVGGKAASLAKLIDAGFNVPDGFVITDGTNVSDKNVQDEIMATFDKLDSKEVAVRSSAVAEDGAKDAWAGQLDTFLNVTQYSLIDKISACFESAGSDRAKSYSEQKQIDVGRVAVIVQRMVPAEISGVAFSAHPVTNEHSKIVIESTRGLGEHLVSGLITPDTYVVDKLTVKTVEKHLQTEPMLDDVQLADIGRTVVEIESLFRFPVDVEWALLNKKLYILQSRPITTLG